MTMRRPVAAIVDDDPRLLKSLANLLESAGYLVHAFSSAGALRIGELMALDVLITDIGMPGLDGFQLRDLVEKARPELPVFLMTGRHELADQVSARDAGFFFRKPFDARALLAAVDDALRGRTKKEGEHES